MRRTIMNTSQTDHRLQPHNTRAEKSVLGAMLLDNKTIKKITGILNENDFYKQTNQLLYSIIIELFQSQGIVDQVSLFEHLNKTEQMKSCGGLDYIVAITDDIPYIANVEHYAKLVRNDSILRQLINLSNKLMSDAYEPQHDVNKLLAQAQNDFMELSKRRFNTEGFTHLRDTMKVTFKKLDAIHKDPDSLQGVPSGFDSLDKLTSGFQNSDLIIVAARPSMGKTAFALSLAGNAVTNFGKSVAIFSLEMSKLQLAMRILCSASRVDANLVRKGKLPSQLFPRLVNTMTQYQKAPLYLNDTANMTILELKSKAKLLQELEGIDLIIVDYLQLLSGGKKFNSREQEISQISRHLKMLAKDLDIPIIALSQLSRAVEIRGGDRRPILSDLRESGSIEQDADLVMFIYRPEKYGILDENGNSQEGIAELIIAKHRNGPPGVAKLGFVERFASFENLSYQPD